MVTKTVKPTSPATIKKLPGVLAFERGTLVTDALMYSEVNGVQTALPVVRHGIRGTQNVPEKPKSDKTTDSAKSSERDVTNVQVTESARLNPGADAMIVKFGVRMLPLDQAMSSCAGKDKDDVATFKLSMVDFIERAKPSDGMVEIARRFARNILNGRWLWRNRTIASAITITVTRDAAVIGQANALTVPLNQFGDYSDAEKAVGEALLDGLLGSRFASLSVEARLTFGMIGSVEVFPSQNYLSDKPKGFARSLYKLGHPEAKDCVLDLRVMGQAALRDQKVANALRTIDTWYPSFNDVLRPIPVEPLGASLSEQEFLREKKSTSFDMFCRLSEIDPSSEEGMFCIAALIRGGVYSTSDKAVKEAKEKAEAAAAADSEAA